MTTHYSEPEYLIIGRVRRAHGIRGDLLIDVLTDYPEHLNDLEQIFIGDSYIPYDLERARQHAKGMLIKLSGINDRDKANLLREQTIFISIDDAIPLEDGEYYLFQLTNIRVVTEEGEELGRVTDMIETGANDVYVVTDDDGNELLLPVIPDVIKNVDVENHIMTVHLLDGLR